MQIKLKKLDLDLSVVKLHSITNPDELFHKSGFISLTKTRSEASLVVETRFVEKDWVVNVGWSVFVVEGSLDFSLVGILNQVLSPLADANISVFTISTFDTDYILVRNLDVEAALKALRKEFEVSEE